MDFDKKYEIYEELVYETSFDYTLNVVLSNCTTEEKEELIKFFKGCLISYLDMKVLGEK